MSREVMQMALDALCDIEITTDLKRLFRDSDGCRLDEVVDRSTEALRAELEKPEPRSISCKTEDELCVLVELLCHARGSTVFQKRISRLREEVLARWDERKKDAQ